VAAKSEGITPGFMIRDSQGRLRDTVGKERRMTSRDITEVLLRVPGGVVGGGYLAADIRGEDTGKTVTVYLRRRADNDEVVGIERTW